MKYMLLLIRSDEAWESLEEDERECEAIGRWWAQYAEDGYVVGGHELQLARTATTIVWTDRGPEVTDGPYMETTETIGGYGIVEAPDLDVAIAVAKAWPARGHKVEIRPVVEGR